MYDLMIVIIYNLKFLKSEIWWGKSYCELGKKNVILGHDFC